MFIDIASPQFKFILFIREPFPCSYKKKKIKNGRLPKVGKLIIIKRNIKYLE